MPERDYLGKVYDTLKEGVEGFDKDENTFRSMMSDTSYASKVHSTLGETIDGFDKTPEQFYEMTGSGKPKAPSFSTDMSNTNTLPVMKDSPLQANVDKPVKVATPTYIDPTKVLKTKDVVDINAEKAPKTMAQIDEESRITMQNRKIFTLTQRGLDESIEYQNLLVKKQAKELGYTDDNSLKGTTAVQKLANDKQEGWREKYLETEELAQVRAFDDYQVFKEQGKEKESNEALHKYLKSRTDYRKGIDNDIVALKGELASAEGDDAVLIRATIAELEAKKLPFYDPKKQMESFLTENETDVAAVSKPTETAQEKLKKYILAQDNLVSNLRNRLGITGKNNSFQRFTDEWKVLQGDRRQKDDLELLHNTELKVKNAVQILELNRTPLDKDSAWGVLAKEFVGELIPMKKGFSGIDNTIAANIGSIVQDADITYAANEKQVETAKFASNQYQFGSAKWVSQNLAPTLAIMVEMIPATLLTEGLGSAGYLSRLSRPLKILAERGSLGAAGGTFFKVIQANKYGRGLLKAAASGVGYGIESQAVTMLAPQLKDEMGFSNGLFAGTVGSVAGQLTGKVMETSLKSIATLFGNKAPQAIAAIEKYGSVIAKTKEFSNTVAGETVEEYGEQLMSIYKESDNYKNFIYNLKKHYETTDALEEFATILMMSVGAPAGSTLGKSLFSASKKAYNNLSRKERETASRMADEIHNEVNLAMDDAANQTIRDENIQVPTRNVEEQDSAILQKQKDLKLPTAPEVVLSDVSKAAMAKMESGEALTIEELKELSNELYQRYNGISATKDQDNRQFTTEQINETLVKLENNITLLENSKNKLEESGETSIVINPKEAVTQEAKPVTSAPNTKFYQGVDFKAQTGLPNGDYTEEQVKAAREAKLKKEGVPPTEIETINAEQEIIPATETPAAPVSGVSGEVQESGNVTTAATSENEIKAKEIGIKLDKLTEDFVSSGKTQKEAEDLAFKSISEEEKQVLRDSYNESRNQPTTKQNDKENGTGVQSNIGEGQEPIKTKPNETTGGEKIEAGGNVQASEEEVAALEKIRKEIKPKYKLEIISKGNGFHLLRNGKTISIFNTLQEAEQVLENRIDDLVNAVITQPIDLGDNISVNGITVDGVTYSVLNVSERMVTIVNIGGVNVPFYLTTGLGGKNLTPSWYPMFGYSQSGWLNKTDGKDMEAYYERLIGKEAADVLKKTAEKLNKQFGTTPNSIKQTGILTGEQTYEAVNSVLNFTTAENQKIDASVNAKEELVKLENNIKSIGKEINAKYDAESAESKAKQAKETTKPIEAKEEATKKTVKVTPKEGDTSITKSARGMIQNMVFKDGEWQIKFGKDFTKVAKSAQQEAQDAFNEKNAPVAVEGNVKVKPYKQGDGGTKGVFEGKNGKLYKSIEPQEVIQDKEGNFKRQTIKDTLTDEYEILSDLQENPHVPKVGKIVDTTEGKAFEIEKLDEVDTFTKDEYREIQKILNDLNDKGYHVGDKVTVMKRPKTGELVIIDFSAGYKGSRMSRDADEYMGDVAKKLSKSDAINIKLEDFSETNKEQANAFFGKESTNEYYLTQRPPSIGTHPTDGLLSVNEAEYRNRKNVYILKYDRKLTPNEIANFELTPKVTNKEFLGQKILGVYGKTPFYVTEIDYKNGIVKMAAEVVGKEVKKEISFREFSKNIDEGKYKVEAPVVKEQAAPPVKAEEKPAEKQKEPVKEQAPVIETPVIEVPKLEIPVVEETVNEPTVEEEEEQYEPIKVSDTSHEKFTKDNAVDYEEGEKEGDNGRSYTYLASVTVELIDDVSGEVIGTISKIKDDYGDVNWSAETNDGDQVADEVGSKSEAQQALVDKWNKDKLKEFNKEKAKAAKEKIKEAEKAKQKAEKEAAKAAKAAEKAAKTDKKSKPEQIGNGLLDLLGIEPEPDVKFSKVSVGKINWSESKIGRGDRAITERNENVKNAAEDLYQGRIGLDEYNDIVDENSPIEPITEFIEPAKEEDIRVAVGDKSEGKINLDFPKGKKVGLRLDIPAYINKNIWAITVHEDGKTGSPLSYNNVARIKNVEFTSDPKVALDIARQKELSSGKKMGKATIARMMGEWMPIEGSNGQLKGESAMKMIDDIKNNPEWAQIGMNPFRHSFFYDRATGNPVVAAEEVIQIGGLVYAKNIETASKNDERFIVKDAKGNPIIGKEGKAVRFSKKEASDKAILSEVEQEQEIVDQMNKMNLVNDGIDLNPSFTTKETIDVTELNSRLNTPLKAVNWAQFKGIPFGFTISDQLTTGDVKLPSTGATIDNLKGGIGFNGTEGNENNAWANTDLSSSASMYSKALEMYNNNKPLFEKLWKEGKLPAGHVPFAVVKMAETSIISNEAIRRVGIENLKNLPKENRKKAVAALKSELERKRKQEADDLVRGTKLKKVKGTPKGVTEYIDTKIPYSKNTAKAKDKIIKQYESILASLDKNNYEDIVDVLKNTDDFTLPAKAVIFNEIFYGDPNKIGQPSKNPGTPSTLVSQTLVEGLDKSKRRLISIGVITDLITEPSMKNVPNMHVISIIGVKVAEQNEKGEWVKAGGSTTVDHPNYKHGVEGKSIGVLTNPVHMKDAFGEAYGSVLGQIVKNEAENASISIDNLLVQGIPVQAGLPNLVLKSAIASDELDAVDKLAGFLRQAFPSTTFFTSEDAWDAAMEDPSVKKKLKDGDVVYAFTTNGNVFINPTLKTTKATLHETGHIWMSFVKENNPALYAKGLQLVTNTREHQKAIKEYGDTELAREEALMELMSSKGDTIVRASDRAKFKEWLLSVYKYVADNFTSLLGLTPKQIENLTLDKFLEGMLADILSGKKVTTKKVKAEKEVKFSLESQNSKIRDYIEKQREAGESDSDIRAGVEMVADKLGLTKEDINNLMSENESNTTTEQAEFTPNAKDIESFKKILEGTTSDAIRINNATKEAKSNPDFNPKILEIMSNFKELKKQLMASVELTEDCSW